MNIIFDILIVLVIFLSAFIGKKRGFVKTFFGLFESVVSFAAASVLSKPIGGFISEKFLQPAISKYFVRAFLNKAGEISSGITFDSLSKEGREFLLRFHIDGNAFDTFFTGAEENVSESLERFFMTISEPISSSVAFAITFVVLFIGISFLFRILIKLADLVSKLPFLNFSNRFFGFVVELLWGAVLALALSHLIALIEPFLQSTEFFRGFSINDTFIVKLLLELNLLS